MIIRLAEIADIQFGPHLKYSEKGAVKEPVLYLHAGHFDSYFKPSKHEHSYVEKSDSVKKYLLVPGDVILAGKGHRLFAWVYEPSIGDAIPSSLFYKMKLDEEQVRPDFLAYYLNSARVQHKLKLIGAGATITSVPKKELLNFKIELPSIKEQDKIIELADALSSDVRLTAELLECKKELKQGMINKLIHRRLEENTT
ncbi:MAG: restriction endonuclease subunit S [Bacteroidia bacterium]|nr:restriction endonuclease subunit S [Bacteroidia bacterium]